MQSLAVELRTARGAKGHSQAEAAAAMGIGITSVSYIEQGRTVRPQADTLGKIADYIGCNHLDLVAAVNAAARDAKSIPAEQHATPSEAA